MKAWAGSVAVKALPYLQWRHSSSRAESPDGLHRVSRATPHRAALRPHRHAGRRRKHLPARSRRCRRVTGGVSRGPRRHGCVARVCVGVGRERRVGGGGLRLARRHGALVSRGFLGRHILTPNTVARIAEQYRRHGAYGIFISRLLPVWRGVVVLFSGGIAGGGARAALLLAAVAAADYGALTYVVSQLGTNLEDV